MKKIPPGTFVIRQAVPSDSIPLPVTTEATPEGLRARAELVRDRLADGGSCADHLLAAAKRIEALELTINQLHGKANLPSDPFEAACDAFEPLSTILRHRGKLADGRSNWHVSDRMAMRNAFVIYENKKHEERMRIEEEVENS